MKILGSLFSKRLYDSKHKLKKNVKLSEILGIKAEHGQLKRAEFYRGGGMNGERYEVSLENKDGEVRAKVLNCPEIGIPERVWVYSAETSALNEAKEYIDKFNLTAWADLPFNDEFIELDAPSSSLRFVFNDASVGGSSYESFSVSFDNVVPENRFDILHGFHKLLLSFVRPEKLIETYLEEDGRRIKTGRDVSSTDEDIDLLLRGYWRQAEASIIDKASRAELGGIPIDPDNDYAFCFWGFDREDGLSFNETTPDGRRTVDLHLDCIEHTPYADYDCSWHIKLLSEENKPYVLTAENDSLFIECDENDGNIRKTRLYQRC